MKELEYPFDAAYIIKKRKSLKKALLADGTSRIRKKIAVFGGSTTSDIVKTLELFLLDAGIEPEFYESEYAQYFQDAMFPDETLLSFKPDIVFIHTTNRNVTDWPEMTDTTEQIDEKLHTEINRFTAMWKSIAEKFHCPIIQNNFEMPLYRLLGSRDAWDIHGRTNFLTRLNEAFYAYARENESFYIHDLNFVSADYGLKEWSNPLFWNMYKYAMCFEAIPSFAFSVSHIIKSIFGKNKKALALDLDNTLWGGVVGDDGVDGLAIGPEVPEGQVYAEFQSYCKALKSIGVILAVDSKNEEANALAGLNHPDGVLRPDDFVCIKANWEPKDRNLLAMASELSLGADSFVFADDNPAERAIVAAQVPGAAVPAMDGAENYIKTLDHGGYFEVTALSKEDLKKTELYHQNAERAKAQAAFADYGEYLDSLQMTATIQGFSPLYIQRIAQLTNKSNQFNLTTLRCSEEDIRTMAEDADHLCLCGKLVDKFGDNGIVTVVAGQQQGSALHMRLWLMSCRVLKRGMEDAMMDTLMRHAAARGIEKVVGYYYPTAKNAMVREFYAQFGFAKTQESEQGTTWELNVADYVPRNPHMKIEEA